MAARPQYTPRPGRVQHPRPSESHRLGWKQTGVYSQAPEGESGEFRFKKEDLGVRMSVKRNRRAFVGGLALTGMGAGTVTGLISSSARGADETSLASKTVGFGWEVPDLNNNGADVYFEVVSRMTLIAVDIDAAFTITSAPASPGLAEVLCRGAVSHGAQGSWRESPRRRFFPRRAQISAGCRFITPTISASVRMVLLFGMFYIALF